jgi:hypothetical protein|uniref:Fe2OG dioxygenase domain-containing protein n=1 Tax=Haptolina ericina TaxID=156174 RepID=A0A7S3BZD8_9EUKA|mmetsp:Transcript_71917/g.159993  ORF Transcript_71917/g.159993 Transcript_71917/m.159993 type:complete len:201 (+) Transcript_71917:445-1047(+)
MQACWVSVDDRPAYDAFDSLFKRMGLPQMLSPIVGKNCGVRLYSAFYVVRSRCAGHNFHTDYAPEAGMNAMTLITPLCDYDETESFQLSYVAHQGGLRNRGSLDEGDPGSEIRRYEYRKGRAIVFGSKFMHSTEPGSGRGGEPHAYLCFTLGTTDQASWPTIERTLGTQSRVVVQPDGAFGFTRLGDQIEEAVRLYRAER